MDDMVEDEFPKIKRDTDVPGTPHKGYTVITNDNIYTCVDQYLRDEDTYTGRLKNKFVVKMEDWDVSKVTNMRRLFSNRYTFDKDLNWDVSNVTDMSGMFSKCENFNGKLMYNGRPWNVSNVTDMSHMFSLCRSFNQPLNWDVSNVTNMHRMFYYCDIFNRPLNWDVSKVIDMSYMFMGCSDFSGPLTWEKGKWDVSKVTYIDAIFLGCNEFRQNIRNWDVSKVREHLHAFTECPCIPPSFDNLQHIVAHEGGRKIGSRRKKSKRKKSIRN